MGMIGSWGSGVAFETSDKRVFTFSKMTQKISGKYAKHSIIGQKDKPEFTGPGSRSLSFQILLDINLGTRPREVMERIEQAAESGQAEYLVIGGRPVGKNKFYIVSVSESYDVIMSRGEIVRASLTLTMEEYV